MKTARLFISPVEGDGQFGCTILKKTTGDSYIHGSRFGTLENTKNFKLHVDALAALNSFVYTRA